MRHEVVSIDPTARTVTVRDLTTGAERIEAYDELVLATGATASPGPSAEHVPTHTLRSVEDVDRILAVLEQAGPEPRVVVVGAGFVGSRPSRTSVRAVRR